MNITFYIDGWFDSPENMKTMPNIHISERSFFSIMGLLGLPPICYGEWEAKEYHSLINKIDQIQYNEDIISKHVDKDHFDFVQKLLWAFKTLLKHAKAHHKKIYWGW